MADGLRLIGFYFFLSALLSVTRPAVTGIQLKDENQMKESDGPKLMLTQSLDNFNAEIADETEVNLEKTDDLVGSNIRNTRSIDEKPEGRFWSVDWVKSSTAKMDETDSWQIPGRFQLSFAFKMNTSIGAGRIQYKKDFD